MEIGVFIPIGNNGWLISTTSPSTCQASSSIKRSCNAPSGMGSISLCR